MELVDVLPIVERLLFAEATHTAQSMPADSVAVFLLLSLFLETDDQIYAHKVGQVVASHQGSSEELRYAWMGQWHLALWKAGQILKDTAFEAIAVAAIRRAHPHFMQGAGLERPRIWGAMDSELEDPTDRAEGNLDGFWGFISYDALNQTSPDPSTPVLKLEVEQVDKVVRDCYLDWTSNSPQELGEALWLCSSANPSTCGYWIRSLRDKVMRLLNSLWEQGYFATEKKFRNAGAELWMCFGLATTTNVPQVWIERRKQILDDWRTEAFAGTISREDQLVFCLATFPGTAWRGYRADPTKDLMALSTRELRMACKSKGIDYTMCREKQELVDLLLGRELK